MRTGSLQSSPPASVEDYIVVGDHYTDQLLQRLQKECSHQAIERALLMLKGAPDRFSLHFSSLPPALGQGLKAYFYHTSDLPIWANREKMKMARQIFSRHGAEMILLAFTRSLPYLFCMPASSFFGNGKSPRYAPFMADIGLFIQVLSYDGLRDTNSSAFFTLQKQRLIFGLARNPISPYPAQEFTRDEEPPFSQVHVMAFSLAFGVKVLEGLPLLGINLSSEQEQAYLHFWNVVAYLLGVGETLIPVTMHSASSLATEIIDQTKSSAEGKALAGKCVDTLRQFVPGQSFRHTPGELMTGLSDEQITDLLPLSLHPASDQMNVSHQAFVNFSGLYARKLVRGLLENQKTPGVDGLRLSPGQCRHWGLSEIDPAYQSSTAEVREA